MVPVLLGGGGDADPLEAVAPPSDRCRFLPKPFRDDELVAALRELITRQA